MYKQASLLFIIKAKETRNVGFLGGIQNFQIGMNSFISCFPFPAQWFCEVLIHNSKELVNVIFKVGSFLVFSVFMLLSFRGRI